MEAGEAAGREVEEGLRSKSLGLPTLVSQSIANVSPTFTPALNVAVVAAIAGPASWFVYLVAMLAMLCVAANVAVLARRHVQAGSYFVYIGRNLGNATGVLAGWILIGTYICTAATVIIGGAIFMSDMLIAFGLTHIIPPAWLIEVAFCVALGWSAVRNVEFSARIGLVLEGVSILIITAIVSAAVLYSGRIVDPVQFDRTNFATEPVMAALVFAVFSFVGFESAATMAKEAIDPKRNIPRALFLSVVMCGIFFVLMSYGIRLVVGDGASEDGNPFTLMTVKAELQWTAGLVYFGALISAFACALASVNAASRLMFSMSRYGVIRASLGKVHPTYKTPYAAVILITIISSAIALITLPAGLIQGYTWTATVTAFGFLSIYAMVCIAAPIESWKRRELGVAGVVIAALGLGLIVFVVVGTLYPVPEYPMNLLPLIFMGYVGAGLAWCLVLRRNAPDVLRDLRKDMES